MRRCENGPRSKNLASGTARTGRIAIIYDSDWLESQVLLWWCASRKGEARRFSRQAIDGSWQWVFITANQASARRRSRRVFASCAEEYSALLNLARAMRRTYGQGKILPF